jgi:hypothetical protein
LPTHPIPSKPPAYDVQDVTPNAIIDFTPSSFASESFFLFMRSNELRFRIVKVRL